MQVTRIIIALLAPLLCTRCVPRIEIATPTTPITINMNVKIDHDITIKADERSQQLLNKDGAAAAQ